MKKILFTLLIICCICCMAIEQNEQQPQSIRQISSTFRVRANTADTIRFASIRLIVDSLEESKEFVFESLRNENLTGLGIMANVTRIFV
ncbi:MAG: hypothetical protein MJZ93_07315 [Paludibacteraceae bacterium]|nr:hypothetical protein [Paludibacteraceae bacterium]